MKKWLKRIRGALGMGLIWATAWFGAGAILGLVAGIYGVVWGTAAWGTPTGMILASAGFFSILFAACGFVGGAAFSTVLAVAEGRRRFDEMSLLRFAAWGAAGSFLLALPLLLSVLQWNGGWFGVGGVLALMGAGSSAGALALARRAEDRELLEHGADVADIGLTAEEKGELLVGN